MATFLNQYVLKQLKGKKRGNIVKQDSRPTNRQTESNEINFETGTSIEVYLIIGPRHCHNNEILLYFILS